MVLKQRATGFTLIELIAVILILGILAVTAAPQFLNLSADARTAAVQGVGGALASASTLNFAQRSLNPASGVAVTNCSNTPALLAGGALPPNYAVTAAPISNGAVVICSVATTNATPNATATFAAMGIN